MNKFKVFSYIIALMIALLIALAIILLTSCEKEDLYCWKCETKTGDEVISTVTACSLTESEIVDFREGLEAQATCISGQLSETECIKTK